MILDIIQAHLKPPDGVISIFSIPGTNFRFVHFAQNWAYIFQLFFVAAYSAGPDKDFEIGIFEVFKFFKNLEL